jgi:thioredoxin-like negative regulator of GroEL
MSRFKILVSALSCCLAFVALADEPSAEIPWITGTTKALKASRETGRPVVVDLWAVWCEPCKVMEKTTFRDPRVLAVIAGFVPLKVDADADTVFVERYDIEIFPTTLFLDEDGREITRLTGLIEADPMLKSLEEVGEGYGSYIELVGRKSDPPALKAVGQFLLEVGNPGGAVPLLRKALKQSKGKEPAELEEIELLLAEALEASGKSGAAAKIRERLGR